MSNYWENKWARAKDNWETRQSKTDSSEEILAGLKKSPGGLGRRSIHKKKSRHILDSGFNVGRSIQVAGIAGNDVATTPLIEITGDDEEARTISLTLHAEKLPPSNTQIDDAFAIVEWGSGGYQTKAEFDILNGIVVNLNCSWLRLVVALDSGSGVNYKYGAFACYANGGLIIPNQRTVRRSTNGNLIGSLAAGARSSAIAIPSFARNVRLISDSNVPFSLEFETEVAVPVGKSFFTSVTGSNFEDKNGVPIPWLSNAKVVKIRNLDALLQLTNPRLIFSLCI